jgi:HlyD family secretion protein
MTPKRLKLVWISALVGLCAIAGLVYWSSRKPAPDVTVQTVARGNISAAISTNGKIEPITPYELRALISSHVTNVLVTEGQNVKRGQLLVELDSTQLQADLARAREAVVANQDALRVAQSGGQATQLAQIDGDIRKDELEHARLQNIVTTDEKLVAQQALTQQQLTDDRASLARVEADQKRLETSRADFVRQNKVDVDKQTLLVQQSQDSLRDLENKFNSTRVTAPVDGTLYSLPVHMNDPVKEGDLLAAVADLRKIRVRAFVDEPDMGGLAPGQHVIVTWDAMPNRTWSGQTAQVPREIVAHGTRMVGELLCALDNNDQKLVPNTNVNVRIEEQTRYNVVVVPRGAISFEGAKRYVYVVDPGLQVSTLHKREVQLGISDSTSDEVVSGLNAGDVIALTSNIEPRDGMIVHTSQTE